MKRLLIGLFRMYQRRISPLKPPTCRFIPTCSSYAIQAVERFGVIRGLYLSTWRFLRCNPFCKSGFDPVPDKMVWFRRRRPGASYTQTEEKT